MDSWLEDQLDLLLTVKTKSEFTTGLSKAAELLEFDYFAYGLRVNMPLSAPKIEMLNNYPLSWQEKYGSQNYVEIDPTVQHGMRSMRPVIWSEELFIDARPLWDDAHAFGLRHGWAQSTLSMPGISGLMTLARSSKAIERTELIRKTNLLVWLTQIAHQGLQDIILPELLPEASVRLTNREIEILRWTADGKTSCEVSMILGIVERTVNFHLNNVMAKLNVINKTAAAVKAIQLGLI